MFEMQQNGRFE